ncbi:hypothetical protein [Halotalea alkalilenta]|uniref:DUF1449 domain-containing protein n=1 Tax=Halotalea alkalilenta TaxID=376489 RepID=A0A172YCY5_9GAMM|nr:hypothetical protein [Halotalea alkalilenta]ANF57108.1 hypothetical protein A5892_06215 [Halotalea alkalilenta]
MDAFIDTLMTFPVVLFAILSAISLLYWALVATRLVKAELFDPISLKDRHLACVFRSLGLGGVPVSLSLSLVCIFATVISFAIEALVMRWFDLGMMGILVGIVEIWLVTTIAIQLTRPVVRMLRPLATRLGATRCRLGSRVEVVDQLGPDEYEVRPLDGTVGETLRVSAKSPVRFALGERLVLVKCLSEGRNGGDYRAVSESSFIDEQQLQHQRSHGGGAA